MIVEVATGMGYTSGNMWAVSKISKRGFTIVELLIVIVVIAILAAVTIVAYNGIQARSQAVALQAEVTQQGKKIELFNGENSQVPGSVTDCPTPVATNICLTTAVANTISYQGYNAATTGSYLPSAGTVLNRPSYEVAVLAPSAFFYQGNAELTRANEFVQYTDMAPIIDKYGPGRKYQISFDIKSASVASASTVNVYMQNGSGSRYTFSANVPVTTSYVRQTVTVTPVLSNGSLTQSVLAFYGTYGTGNIPTVKNVQMQLAP